jgi:hypothetical protein
MLIEHYDGHAMAVTLKSLIVLYIAFFIALMV